MNHVIDMSLLFVNVPQLSVCVNTLNKITCMGTLTKSKDITRREMWKGRACKL